MRLTRGWHTDLAILRMRGADIAERSDHLVLTTPSNPEFHWGNTILVTDPDSEDDADRWLDTFARAHPAAAHVAIGLPRLPRTDRWAALGVEVGTDQVLFTDRLPEQRVLPAGYTARPLARDDWEQHVDKALRHNEETGEYDPARHERFVRNQVSDRLGLIESGLAQWFGAYAEDGTLVADLGIVDCGEGVARYQAVGTDAAHRGRGLAGHLLGLAARWAGSRGCHEWVIVTESDNPAGRLYRSVGFRPDVVQVSAYRRPARPS